MLRSSWLQINLNDQNSEHSSRFPSGALRAVGELSGACAVHTDSDRLIKYSNQPSTLGSALPIKKF